VNNVPASAASAYHWYLSFNMRRWRLGKGPCTWFGNEDTGNTPSLTSWSLTNHRNWIKLNWPASGYANVLSVIWHKGPVTAFAVSPATAIDVQPWTAVRDTLVIDQPKEPGSHYYRLQLFSYNGIEFIQPTTTAVVVS